MACTPFSFSNKCKKYTFPIRTIAKTVEPKLIEELRKLNYLIAMKQDYNFTMQMGSKRPRV